MTQGPDNNDEPGRRNRNIGAGIGIGIALGAGLGLLMDNLALGMSMGIAIGVPIGAGSAVVVTEETNELRTPTKILCTARRSPSSVNIRHRETRTKGTP